MRGAVLSCLALLLLSLSGCAGARNTGSGSQAPAPVVSDETGSLVGIAFDQELLPIPVANVSVEEGPATVTDASGAFTLNGLAAGVHKVTFTKEGFEPLVKQVDIAAEEVTQIRVELKPMVAESVHHWSFSRVGLVRVGQWSVQYAQHLVNNSVVDAALCDPCSYPVTLQPFIVDAVTDVQYTRAVSVPYINEYVTLAYTVAQTTGGSLKLLMTHDFPPRQSYQWSSVQVRELRGYEKVRLEFHGPDLDTPGLLVNQKIEVWQTFAHGQPLPAGFTLLPT